MKIYVGASFADKEHMQKVAHVLMGMGHLLTNQWLWWEPEQAKCVDQEKAIAVMDTVGVLESDLTIISYVPRSTKGGSDVELGIGLGKKATNPTYDLWIVGPLGKKPNGFYHHPDITWIPDWSTAYRKLRNNAPVTQ